MLETINNSLNWLVAALWNWPVVLLCLGAGLYLTFVLRGIQFRAFIHAVRVVTGKYDRPDQPGQISHLQALFAAVSATVGLGNIAGVAIAVSVGGPGSLFWMWLMGILGMATKFAECGLGAHYRIETGSGEFRGGAMFYITRGVRERFPALRPLVGPLAGMFAFSCLLASLGVGNMFQARNVAGILSDYYGVPPMVSGFVLAVLIAIVIIGGIKRIGRVAGILIPAMCGIYLVTALGICVFHWEQLPHALGLICSDAFSGQAAAGGSLGVVIMTGVRRGVFSSEAGLGSAPIAHAAAQTDVPLRQGMVAILEPFIDTVLVCSATGIVIVLSGSYGPNFELEGVSLCARAFEVFIPGFGRYFLSAAVVLFALSTAITWSYYGETASVYLLGSVAVRPFKVLFVIAVFLGAIWPLGPVIAFSDLSTALMVIPNLLAVLLLSGKVAKLTSDYFQELRSPSPWRSPMVDEDHRDTAMARLPLNSRPPRVSTLAEECNR